MRYLLFFLLITIPYSVSLAFNPDSTKICDSKNSCCNSADLTPTGLMMGHPHEKNDWMISYRYMSMTMEGILTGTEKTDHNFVFNNYLMSPGHMKMEMHMLMFMYGLSDRLALMTMLNYQVINMNMVMMPTSTHIMNGKIMSGDNMNHHINTASMSDVNLTAQYHLLDKSRHQVLVWAGINIPTGNIEIKDQKGGMYNNLRLPYNMQAGSGTWDVLSGISYQYMNDDMAYGCQLNSVYRPGINSVGYTLGNEVTINNWIAYRWSRLLSTSFRLEGNTCDPIKGRDKKLPTVYEPSADPVNYGCNKLGAFGGANFYFGKGFLNSKAAIEAGVPIYQNLNGTQMALKFSCYVSWAFSF